MASYIYISVPPTASYGMPNLPHGEVFVPLVASHEDYEFNLPLGWPKGQFSQTKPPIFWDPLGDSHYFIQECSSDNNHKIILVAYYPVTLSFDFS